MPAKKSRETASGDADPLEVKIQGGSIATGEAGTPGPGSYHTDELAPKRSKLSSTGSSPGESQMCENGVMRCVVVENFSAPLHLSCHHRALTAGPLRTLLYGGPRDL